MYKALHLSPMIQSSSINGTVSFFKDVLGFKFLRDEPNYGILIKDNLTIHISQASHEVDGAEFYLEVDDIENLWSVIQGKLDGIKVKEPFDQPYGMREIHIAVPHTNTILFIGAGINR